MLTCLGCDISFTVVLFLFLFFVTFADLRRSATTCSPLTLRKNLWWRERKRRKRGAGFLSLSVSGQLRTQRKARWAESEVFTSSWVLFSIALLRKKGECEGIRCENC
jgi:hypothetical protein